MLCCAVIVLCCGVLCCVSFLTKTAVLPGSLAGNFCRESLPGIRAVAWAHLGVCRSDIPPLLFVRLGVGKNLVANMSLDISINLVELVSCIHEWVVKVVNVGQYTMSVLGLVFCWMFVTYVWFPTDSKVSHPLIVTWL